MNKETIIKVRTAIGETEEAEVEDSLGQGGVESGILSALSLSNGVFQFFEDCVNDMFYGNVTIKAIMWQDDVMMPSASLLDAQECNWRMEAVLSSKNLSFNLLKSVFLVIGNKSFRESIEKQLADTPLLLMNETMTQVDSYPYFGEIISTQNIGHSALMTIINDMA